MDKYKLIAKELREHDIAKRHQQQQLLAVQLQIARHVNKLRNTLIKKYKYENRANEFEVVFSMAWQRGKKNGLDKVQRMFAEYDRYANNIIMAHQEDNASSTTTN